MTTSLQKNIASLLLIASGLFLILNIAFSWHYDSAAWILAGMSWLFFGYWKLTNRK
ncbi:hypothetical protein [Alteriqipengyuania lutimaris]|uniref:hypothetical protein n=1 Tax=Alteriqipengyuania lutimaris TaxID=1538146 RepID=UPI0015F19DD7|nr:hypothetical protein [Alteriqipengyuania lutimaris]MBB3034987.1 hypothetical protein [Alteriqipengyuania lutimaris]